MKSAAAFSRKESKKLKRQTVDAKKMIQKPAIPAKNIASGQRAKTGFLSQSP